MAAIALSAIGVLALREGDISRNYDYTKILDTIAKGESNGNYNAYYGEANNSKIKFTSMKVQDVLAWQKKFVEKGSPSSAVGKYQFIRPTLQGLVDELDIDGNETFSPDLQDKLAIVLLKRRGVYDYMDEKISKEQFAYNLSKEWAALPIVKGDKPEASYYAGDGLNEVRTTIDEISQGIDSLHESTPDDREE